jgi:hypothetical protein
MYIVFDNQDKVNIALHDTPLKSCFEQMFKHLSNIQLPFRDWENPYYKKNLTMDQIVGHLITVASRLNIKVDNKKCQQQDQKYLNELHKIYEQGYDGSPAWLEYHDQIHLCESTGPATSLILDYKELAGPLVKSMNLSWMEHSTLDIQPGDVYITWSELGKTPYQYWRDQEPEDTNRLCVLAKPWLNLIPKFMVALEPRHRLDGIDQVAFQTWWAQYESAWCEHWNLKSWTLKDMCSAIVIGSTDNQKISYLLSSGANPIYVKLD